jgi:purine-nucleoside phosphorylase
MVEEGLERIARQWRNTMDSEYPILEFDPAERAIFNPEQSVQRLEGVPRGCVICFFQDVLGHLVERGETVQIATLNSELGVNPVFTVSRNGSDVALVHPGVGAPMAVFVMEEMIALGCEHFIVCGGAGVLDPAIAVGHVVVPIAAIRDEGTSYHYLPPAREVEPDPEALDAVAETLRKHKVDFRPAKTWTTDAIYRETQGKVERRRAEGCATVEMEAAALFAVGKFRRVPVAQLLYGGDDVSGIGEWDHRGWISHGVREDLLGLAVESCLELGRQAGARPE